MKKVFNLSMLFFCVFIYTTCSKEESNSFKSEEASIIERVASCKDIASYHSEGLDFAYNKLKEIKRSNPSKNLFHKVSREDKMILINSLSVEFVSQQKVVSELSEANKKIDFLMPENTSNNEVVLRSSDGSKLTPNIKKIYDFFDSVINSVSYGNMQDDFIFENIIKSAEFIAFSTEEQNTLLLMLAIYDDSSKYWGENINNWKQLINEDNPNISLRSSVEGELDDISLDDDLKLKLFTADAVGGVIGAYSGGVGGLIGGAIIGSFAGGVGAGPGALAGGAAGAITGGIAGAISASITAAVTPSMLAPYSSSEELANFLKEEVFFNIDLH